MRTLIDLEKKYPAMPRVESKCLSRVPAIVTLCGSTGSGKSYTAIQLIRCLREEGSVTRVFVISPTVSSNAILNHICTSPRDWKIDPGPDIFKKLKEIVESCEADALTYREELEYCIARKRYVDGEPISVKEEMLLERRGFKEIKPVRPSPLLFLDDMQSSDIFTNSNKNYFTNLVLKSRHIGDGLGLTIVMAAQSSRGIPRTLRLNTTHFFIWSTKSNVERKLLYEELGSMFTEKEFDELLDRYTATPHGYLLVDTWAKKVADSF